MATETLESAHRAAGGKYLTFNLGQEAYGVPVLKIREIIRLANITPVPQVPAHIKGVINLRGKIIPVVDLHVKFGLPAAANSDRACIVVVQVHGSSSADILLGLLVDDVQEVSQIGSGEIEAAPEFGSQVNTDCILGMAKLKSRVVILLDIDKTLSPETLELGVPSAAPKENQ